MENNENNGQELEEMRAQLTVLKNKLDKEAIINERLLRDTMKRKANVINANAWVSVGAGIFVILWAVLFLPEIGFSWYFVIATIVMMLVCIFFTYKQHKNVNDKTMNGDLLTVAKVMKKLKQDYQYWLKYAIIMVAVWFIWLCIEFVIILGDWKLSLPIVVASAVGLVIGGFIGLRMHRSVIHNAEDIIKQIEE